MPYNYFPFQASKLKEEILLHSHGFPSNKKPSISQILQKVCDFNLLLANHYIKDRNIHVDVALVNIWIIFKLPPPLAKLIYFMHHMDAVLTNRFDSLQEPSLIIYYNIIMMIICFTCLEGIWSALLHFSPALQYKIRVSVSSISKMLYIAGHTSG